MFRFGASSGNKISAQSTNNVLGINLDGEKLLLVYGSLSGHVYESLLVPTGPKSNFQTLLDHLSIEADKLFSLVRAQHLPLPDRVSVAITGNYDSETGILSSAADFPDLADLAIRSQISLQFNLPVFMQSKANAGALTEKLFNDNPARNLVFVSLDPILRLGLLVDGKPYRNHGGSSGDIGILPSGESNALGRSLNRNEVCSSTGMLSYMFRTMKNHWNNDATLLDMIKDALQGDPYAIEGFTDLGKLLGKSLGETTILLRPELFVIGYPACLLGELIEKPVREGISLTTGLADTQLPAVHASSLGHQLPMMQALAAAIADYRQTQKS